MRANATYGRARSLGIVVTVVLLVSACGSTAPIPTSGSTPASNSGPSVATSPATSRGTDSPSAAGPSPAGPTPVASSTAAAPGSSPPALNGQGLPASRQDLIAQAVGDGRIDHVTSLLYRAYALFGMPELPAEFAGAPSRGDDAALFEQITEESPGLSPEDQARLRPFITRPTEPDSVFSGGLQPLVAGLAGGVHVAAAGTECHDWVDSRAASQHVKVWACAGSDAAAASHDVATVASLMEELWAPMTMAPPAGMGPPIADGTGPNVPRELGGDGRIDVYVLSPGEAVYRAGVEGVPATSVAAALSSPPYTDANGTSVRTSSGFMLVNRARIGDRAGMRQDLIHEFFHILQKAHNRVGPFKGAMQHWFGEASATWAEAYYSPETSGQVHTWFSSVFQLSHVGLESTVPDHDYAAYIWPFFMAQDAGANAVFQAWVGIEAAAPGDFKAVSDAIDAQLPFAGHFRDFAVRNLNRQLAPTDPPQVRYVDADSNFPDGISPVPIESGELSTKVSYRSPLQSLEPLAASYFYLVPDDDARDITIDLTLLSPVGTLDGDVLLHINGKWERRTIDGNVLHLCRDEPADNFDQAHLILSNHGRNPSDKITGQFEIRSKPACLTGHYSIDVANVGGGHHKGSGHHEGDGQVICTHAPSGDWIAYGVYFPTDRVDPGKDISDFHIATTPGHMWVSMTLMNHTTDSPTDWSVLSGFENPIFRFDVKDKVRPITITAVADDHSQHVKISVTCSVLNLG
jgi:hypothetical protein